MVKNRPWMACAISALILGLVAGCSKGGDDPAGTADGWQIPAGTYRSIAKAQMGFEVHLSEGDKSPVAALSLCRPDCATPIHAAVMRGLNGISFSLSDAGHMVDVTLTPASMTEIMLAADWGKGLESVTLRRVEDRDGNGAAPADSSAAVNR